MVSAGGGQALLTQYERIPARAAAAAQVLRLVDDPDSSAQDLARAIGTDPALAAKVLRIANSTYYGLSGRVSTLPFAVSVVGFQTIRGLAVIAAAGLDEPGGVPEGFWHAATLTAAGTEFVAGLVGADQGDAFCLGLLHTIGAALLHRHHPGVSLCLPEPPDIGPLLDDERDRYGMTHDELGAKLLTEWHVPHHLCSLIGRHHEVVLPDATPLERSLRTARILASLLLTETTASATQHGHIIWLTEGRLGEEDLAGALTHLADRSAGLLGGLTRQR
jgi:HD-like signal output (HDOD) protein